ncbi:MAG: phenylalanine--tRNA ligase subunit beta [Acholeplasmatales bacterium]|nr:phenylalanine--tRNA ligase subunit beta [Acholeplasmatales bacterium]
MKVSKNWLSDYLDLSKYTDEQLFSEINAHINEIESYEKMVNATNLTVGYVLECVPHPDSDHLHVCQVEVKPGDVQQIVCGAPNVDKGEYVIVANVGAVLPGDFKIKASKIRGVESNGMLCSLQELGIEEKYVPEAYKNGIYNFKEGTVKVGDDPLKALGADDTIIDLELTSNRSDLLSIEGVAYDLGAVLSQKVVEKTPSFKEEAKANPMKVEVKTDKCYKYLMRYLSNVTIKESPMWMKARLVASGVRPINNVVDITNYVLMELGQPLHSFDADKLGDTVVVRLANDGEKLVTLDEQERELKNSDVVITDGKSAVCVGGVMGGLSTEVTEETKNIALEAAYFDPLAVRKTSARLNLKSESSVRFERKIDYDRVERALDYATELLVKYADAKVLAGVAKDVKVELPKKKVNITTAKINSVLGTNLTDEYVNNVFDRLAYSYVKNGLEYEITLPSRRMDLEESVQDIIEDVARINGYDSIPTTIAKTRDKGYLTYSQKRTRLVRQILAFMGLNEAVNYSLISQADLGLYIPEAEVKEPIKVLMPLTEDRAVLRESVLNGLIENVAYNKARKNDDIALFEIANVHTVDSEDLHLGIVINGLVASHLWNGQKNPASFFILKGIFEALCEKLNFDVTYVPCKDYANFHPGRTAAIMHNNEKIGVIGELHPRFAKAHDCQGTIALEIDLKTLINDKKELNYHPINKFPSISRDLALVVKKDVAADTILNLIKQTGKQAVTSIKIFDVYTGENVADDEKSLAFNITFEDATKTLETQEVDKLVDRIVKRLERECNAKLRA